MIKNKHILRTFIPLDKLPKRVFEGASYAARQRVWIFENDISIGSIVRVTRRTDSYSLGWPASWSPYMNFLVGQEHIIFGINRGFGLILENENRYTYPYFVLEKVE